MFSSIDLKKLEEISNKIHAQEMLLNNLWRESTDLICVVNNTHFLKVNPSWTRELGWSSAELLSKPYLEFVHPEDVQNTKGIVDVLPNELQTNTKDFINRYRTKSGEYKNIQWFVSTITIEGEIYCLAKVV